MSQRFEDVFEPDNASDAALIKGLLNHEGIPAEVLSFHDTAFDGIFQAQKGWGRIRVAAEDADRARAIIREWQEAPAAGEYGSTGQGGYEHGTPGDKGAGHRGGEDGEDGEDGKNGEQKDLGMAEAPAEGDSHNVDDAGPMGEQADDPDEEHDGPGAGPPHGSPGLTDPGTRGSSRIFLSSLLVISVALNLFLLFWKNRNLPNETELIHDAQGRLVAKAHYHDGADIAYLIEEFDTHGVLSVKMEDRFDTKRYDEITRYDSAGEKVLLQVDRNSDGRNELTLVFHRGRLVARVEDTNLDGRYDRLTQLDRGQPRAAFEDRDADGRTDRVMLLGQGSGRAQLEDLDRDGFPEILTCSDQAGKRLRVDALRCAVHSP